MQIWLRRGEFYKKAKDWITEFSPDRTRFWIFLSAAALFFGLFIKFSYNVFLDSDDAPYYLAYDQWIMNLVTNNRIHSLNLVAIDLTALGSVTIVTLVSLVFVTVFALARDYLSLIQLAMTGIGAGIWTTLFKSLIERPRPPAIDRLVEAAGTSFPSGHSLAAASLYFTFAIMAGRYFRRWWEHLTLYGIAGTIVMLVAVSRVYLGVHYPTDVISGCLLGAAWSFFVAAFISWIARHIKS